MGNRELLIHSVERVRFSSGAVTTGVCRRGCGSQHPHFFAQEKERVEMGQGRSGSYKTYSISCCCCMASLTTSPSRVSMVLMVTVFLVWTSELLCSGLVSRKLIAENV